MRGLGAYIGVSFFGILSFALTVIAVTVGERLTGYNLFSVSVWVIVPVGAGLTGAAAASGYYVGSLFFQTRPTWFLFVQMVIVAAIAQLAIYYGEYITWVYDNGTQVAEAVSFRDYLGVYLTTLHLRIGRALASDTGEVGTFGYWLAVIQFVGFLAGGIVLFLLLVGYPTCRSCGRYLRTVLQHSQYFNDQTEASRYYDNVFRWEMDSPEFSAWMKWQPLERKKAKPGSVSIITTIKGCKNCKCQALLQQVSVMSKKHEWNVLTNLSRRVEVPGKMDARLVFQ